LNEAHYRLPVPSAANAGGSQKEFHLYRDQKTNSGRALPADNIVEIDAD
jgi:hypothetical protein